VTKSDRMARLWQRLDCMATGLLPKLIAFRPAYMTLPAPGQPAFRWATSLETLMHRRLAKMTPSDRCTLTPLLGRAGHREHALYPLCTRILSCMRYYIHSYKIKRDADEYDEWARRNCKLQLTFIVPSHQWGVITDP